MLSLSSPAKINLFLRILGRRADGYHELASLFQAIELADTLHFEKNSKNSLTCSDPALPVDESNLIVKAQRLFQRKTGIMESFAIHLEKRIPVQAGLGGGSSNAASTLWGLNTLSGYPATEQQLCEWGSELGSDVSFFLSSGTAYCTGRGEIVTSLDPLPSQSLNIIKPPKGLSTIEVYKNLNPVTLSQIDPNQIVVSFYQNNPIYINDLESSAFALMPELAILKQKLKNSGYSTVLMSGSGSSLFCFGKGDLQIENHQVFSTSFTNRITGNWYKF